MRPVAEANPEYIEALRELLLRIERTLADSPKRLLPVRMTIAGGAALHCHVGSRVSRDVDATFSRRLALGDDVDVAYRDTDGLAQYLFVDRAYNDTFGLLHEDAGDDAVPLTLSGIDAKVLDVRLLTPLDLAVSKLARFADIDRQDIETLAKRQLITARSLRKRAEEALDNYVGDLSRVRGAIDTACRLIERYSR
jgi:hypothetical protein